MAGVPPTATSNHLLAFQTKPNSEAYSILGILDEEIRVKLKATEDKIPLNLSFLYASA